MLDMMFGTGSAMWTAVPFAGLPYQAIGFGPRSIATPVFSSPVVAGGISRGGLTGGSTGGQELLGSGQPSTAYYGYGGGMTPNAQQTLAVPGLALAYPFAPNPLAAQIADTSGVVSAASMLAAVAMRR